MGNKVAAVVLCLSLWLLPGVVNAQKSPQNAAETESIHQTPVFRSEEGRFSVQLPVDFPAFETKNTDDELREFMSQSGRGVCAIFFNDFSADVVNALSTMELLDAGQAGILDDSDVTLKKAEDFTVGGYPARRIQYSEMDKGRMYYTQTNLVFVSPRLYQVYYSSTSPTDLEDPAIQGYFTSFNLK